MSNQYDGLCTARDIIQSNHVELTKIRERVNKDYFTTFAILEKVHADFKKFVRTHAPELITPSELVDEAVPEDDEENYASLDDETPNNDNAGDNLGGPSTGSVSIAATIVGQTVVTHSNGSNASSHGNQ